MEMESSYSTHYLYVEGSRNRDYTEESSKNANSEYQF